MRSPWRLAALLVVLAAVTVVGAEALRRARRDAATGRAPVVLPAVPATRAARADPAGTTIATRFAPPDGATRTPAPPGSFAAWLRALPLRPHGAPVRLFDGRLKARQDAHAAVVARDPGARDLQQCADAAMRLRAEFLHAAGRADEIAFHFVSGFRCDFATWATGRRVAVRGNDATWVAGGAADASEAALARYLDVVYAYAGTASLPRDVEEVPSGAPAPGDVYLKPGSPGHAMIVVDAATRGATTFVLLAQSYMPAQELHVVRNPAGGADDPWYAVGEGPALATPEWRFPWSALRRFRGAP